MSVLICFNNKDPKPWKETLEQKLKGVPVEIYPHVSKPEKVTFALCWKPDADVLSAFPNLKVVQSVGASVEHITQTQTLGSNVTLTRIVDPQLSQDMFEFVLTGVLNHLKTTSAYSQNQLQKKWTPQPYKTIQNTTVGVLGLGKIGSYVAQELQKVGFSVKAWSRSEKFLEPIDTYHSKDGLDKMIEQTDVLVNILPLTKETEDLLNRERLSRMPQESFLINVGRGEHLVEQDLLDLVENGTLAGALLDVFRTEPLPKEHPFWSEPKISITPHIAAITNLDTASDLVVSNYQKKNKNEALDYVVSLEKGY